MAFLSPLWDSLDRMATGARITYGLDPKPPPNPDPGKIHPVAQARDDAFFFSIALIYPDETGQQVKEEIKTFMDRLQPHPHVKYHSMIIIHDVSIRLEITNLIRWNSERIWLMNNKVITGTYDDMKGIRIRAWGLDPAPEFFLQKTIA